MRNVVISDEQFASMQELEVFLRMLGRMSGEKFDSDAMDLKEALQVFADDLESIIDGIRKHEE